MKKTVFIFIIFFSMFQACQKKALPTIATRTHEPARPVTIPVDVKPDLALGKTIFTNRCGRCHDLPDPAKYTAQRWDGILSVMNVRARLDQPQQIHVTAYIKANCLK